MEEKNAKEAIKRQKVVMNNHAQVYYNITFDLIILSKRSQQYTNHLISQNKILVDCKWSEYGEWSECSVTCGKGHKTATRKVIREAQNGGRECKGKSQKTKPCEHGKCKGS